MDSMMVWLVMNSKIALNTTITTIAAATFDGDRKGDSGTENQ